MMRLPDKNSRRDASLHKAADVHQLALEAAPDAMVIVNQAGKIVLINAQTEELFGYARDDLLGRPLELLVPERFRGHHPEYRAEYVTHPRVRPMGAGLELAGRRRDGTEVEIDIRLSPLEVDGDVLICASIRDVGPQKAQERELERARKEAELASEAKSRLLAIASHDLRQPVQAAVNYLYILRRELGAGCPATVSKLQCALDTHRDQLDRLLDISKLEAGRVKPELTQVSLEVVFERLANELRPVAQAKGLELRIVPSSLRVTTDPVLLNQMLQNLLSNAIRYTEEGRVLLGCRRGKAQVRIQVIDSGPGIPEAHLEKIFSEFYQVEKGVSVRQRGLGLGLYIVSRLSQLLDHPISVRSELGRGALFEIRLPVATPAEDASFAEACQEEVSTRGALLVLVEDESEVLESTILILELLGHQVIAGSSAAEVLGTLAKADRIPDLILSDYQLEDGMTGPEVIRDLRDILDSEVPAVLLTGDSSRTRLDEAQKSGYRLLSKPIDPEDLEQALDELLRDPPSS